MCIAQAQPTYNPTRSEGRHVRGKFQSLFAPFDFTDDDDDVYPPVKYKVVRSSDVNFDASGNIRRRRDVAH